MKMKIEKDKNIFTIERYKEHYIVKKNSVFYETTDTLKEAIRDIETENK